MEFGSLSIAVVCKWIQRDPALGTRDNANDHYNTVSYTSQSHTESQKTDLYLLVNVSPSYATGSGSPTQDAGSTAITVQHRTAGSTRPGNLAGATGMELGQSPGPGAWTVQTLS